MEYRTFLRSSFPTEVLSEIFSNLNYSDLLQVCSQDEYRDIFDDVFWKNKAQKDFGVSVQMFDFYKGQRDGGFCRPISASYRYLELLSNFRLIPQLLVKFNPPVLSGFYTPIKFLMQAIRRNDLNSISLFLSSIESFRPEIITQYSELSNDEKANILHSTLEFVQSHCKARICFSERPILTKQDSAVLVGNLPLLKEIHLKEGKIYSTEKLFGSSREEILVFAFDVWKRILLDEISSSSTLNQLDFWIETTLVFAARNPNPTNFLKMIEVVRQYVPRFNLDSLGFLRRITHSAYFSCNFELLQTFPCRVYSQWAANEVMQGSRSFPGRSEQILDFLSKTFFSLKPESFFLRDSDVEETFNHLKQIDNIDVFQYISERQFICRPKSLLEIDPSVSQDASRLWMTLSFGQAVLSGQEYLQFQQSVRKVIGDKSDPNLLSIVNFFFSESASRL